MRVPFLQTHLTLMISLKVLSPNVVTLVFRPSTYDFERYTIQFITEVQIFLSHRLQIEKNHPSSKRALSLTASIRC